MIGGSPGQVMRESVSLLLKSGYVVGDFKNSVLRVLKIFNNDPAVVEFIGFKIKRHYKEHLDWYNMILVLL